MEWWKWIICIVPPVLVLAAGVWAVMEVDKMFDRWEEQARRGK